MLMAALESAALVDSISLPMLRSRFNAFWNWSPLYLRSPRSAGCCCDDIASEVVWRVERVEAKVKLSTDRRGVEEFYTKKEASEMQGK